VKTMRPVLRWPRQIVRWTVARRARKARKAPSLADLSPEQRATLIAYAILAGPAWKAKLRGDWMRAGTAIRLTGGRQWAHLQQIRNTLGPAWLADLRTSHCCSVPVDPEAPTPAHCVPGTTVGCVQCGKAYPAGFDRGE
jgi:hypothetical protein